MSEVLLEQISHFLLGTAIGDAFGAGVEFQDRDWIRAHVDFSELVNVRDHIQVTVEQKHLFTENYSAWDYTDDTEMTIGLMKALCDASSFSENLLVQYWKAEYLKGMKQKGYGRNGHGSMGWYYRGEQDLASIRAFQRDRNNPGNAPLMRVAPLAWAAANKINNYAAINATATHPNPQAILASQCIARAAYYIMILQEDPLALIEYCRDSVSLNSRYDQQLELVDSLPDYDQLGEAEFEILCGPQPIQAPYFLPGIQGVPSDAFYTTASVLYILKHSKTAMDALRKAIYLGGDVDSVASLATGMLAARYGLESLPKYMLDQVEGSNYLLALAHEFAQSLSKQR